MVSREAGDDVPDIVREVGPQAITSAFLVELASVYARSDTREYPLTKEDAELVAAIEASLERVFELAQQEKQRAASWTAMEHRLRGYRGERAEVGSGRLQDQDGLGENPVLPRTAVLDLQFDFVQDAEIKRLLESDAGEAGTAYANGLYKCAVVLCGGILEA